MPIRRHLLISGLLLVLVSCAGSPGRIPRSAGYALEDLPEHTGVYMAELASGKEIWSQQPDKLFVPASTTKLITWRLAMESLEDRPALFHYAPTAGKGIYLKPAGHPFLGIPGLDSPGTQSFLQRYDTLYLTMRPKIAEAWGPGWSWEDFPYSYSVDRTNLPVYGNRLWVWEKESRADRTAVLLVMRGADSILQIVPPDTVSFEVLPHFLRDSIRWMPPGWKGMRRDRYRNLYRLAPPGDGDTLQVPFISGTNMLSRVLSEFTDRAVVEVNANDSDSQSYSPFRGPRLDSILKPMLLDSDNFLAEQLVLMSALSSGDSLPVQVLMDSLIHTEYPTFLERIRWVDGSGLSRYNLCSPRFLSAILMDIHHERDSTYWMELLPRIDMPAQMKDSTARPLIYAKSGSMGGIYNLAGFMKSKKGKWIVFALMNNHSTEPRSAMVRKSLALLRSTYDLY